MNITKATRKINEDTFVPEILFEGSISIEFIRDLIASAGKEAVDQAIGSVFMAQLSGKYGVVKS